MKMKDGQYYYARHRNLWGVWQWHNNANGSGDGTFYNDYPTKEEAREVVFRLNGWGEPKKKDDNK